jgi:hypothetical protein
MLKSLLFLFATLATVATALVKREDVVEDIATLVIDSINDYLLCTEHRELDSSNNAHLLYRSRFVDVSELDTAELIIRLWNATKPFALPTDMRYPDATHLPRREYVLHELKSNSRRIGYLKGRQIACDFTTDEVLTWDYNRIAGPCMFEYVVTTMRIEKAREALAKEIINDIRSVKKILNDEAFFDEL